MERRHREFVAACLLASACAFASPCRGQENRPIVISVQKGSDVAADDVRRAVASELGAPVVFAEDATDAAVAERPPVDPRGAGWLEVDSRNGILRVAFRDSRGRRIEREMTAPADGAARVRTIALLAGNLARNEADDFAPKDRADPRAPSKAPPETGDPPSDDTRARVQVWIAPGEEVEVHVARAEPARAPATPSGAVAPAAQRETREPPPVASEGAVQRTLGWIAIAAGGASLGTGVALAIMARSKWNDSRAQCAAPGSICTPIGAAEFDSARTTAVQSNWAFGVGALLAGTGVIVELTAPRASAATSVSLGPASIAFSRTW
jgi:hypothetical protein